MNHMVKQFQYIGNSETEQQAILDYLGIKSAEDLFVDIPKEYRDSNLFYGLTGQSLISPFDSENPLIEPKIKLGILASGNGSNFEFIVKSIKNNQLNAEISILIVNLFSVVLKSFICS